MAKLDKNKPYGQVSGEHGGAAFEQNGLLFDAHGNELTVDAAKAEPVEAKVTRSKPAKAEPVEEKIAVNTEAAAVDAQLAAQGA